MSAVRLTRVTKKYGSQTALRDLSFTVPRGSICGLIGPNGAGKTTCMGLLAGLLQPQAGTIDLLESGPFSVASHAGRLGIMPQDSTPSLHAPIAASLTYYCELQGLSSLEAQQEAARCLELVQLGERSGSKYGELSHGMRRRFSIAQALLGSPELVLLDEPTSGLDPELVVEIRELICSLRGKSTVVVSSHILSELESMCDYAVFLEAGECVREGPMSAITNQGAVSRFRLNQEPPMGKLSAALSQCKVKWSEPYLSVTVPSEQSTEDVNGVCLRICLDSGIGILELSSGDSLESAYMRSRQERM